MKLVALSDTHGLDFTNSLPKGDMLIHCGDWTNNGTIPEIIRFNTYCSKIIDNFPLGIWITPGNHDWLAQTDPNLCESLLTNCNLMINESAVISGVNFYFSPITPEFCGWAFMREEDEIAHEWNKIPDNTNVLITHGPPFRILDMTEYGDRAGCRELASKVSELPDLKLHLFGHIHKSYDRMLINGVTYANVASHSIGYSELGNAPMVFEV